MVNPQLSILSQLFVGSGDFPNYPPKAVWRFCVDHIQLWAVAVYKLPSQTKVAIMNTNIRPVLRFAGLVFSHREMSRITWVSQGAF